MPSWLTFATGIVTEILNERKRQHVKWGSQTWPDKLPDDHTTEYWAFQRDRQRRKVDAGLRARATCWTDIFMEELYEALAEEDWKKKRAELVQAAAVIAAWIADGDLRPEPQDVV